MLKSEDNAIRSTSKLTSPWMAVNYTAEVPMQMDILAGTLFSLNLSLSMSMSTKNLVGGYRYCQICNVCVDTDIILYGHGWLPVPICWCNRYSKALFDYTWIWSRQTSSRFKSVLTVRFAFTAGLVFNVFFPHTLTRFLGLWLVERPCVSHACMSISTMLCGVMWEEAVTCWLYLMIYMFF